MTRPDPDQLSVWLDDPAFGPLQRIGLLSRGDRGSIRFAYERAWLKNASAVTLDPELDLAAGEFYPSGANFGVFMDSCPDRWGQTLMRRREVIEARQAGRTVCNLAAWDYLLDESGQLWIAKFPSADDDYYYVALWEMLLHELANYTADI